jgi:transposase-like protein
MVEISYRRHRFPPMIIQHAVWLYLRFTLSYRDVEELLAERGSTSPSRRSSGIAANAQAPQEAAPST